MGFFSSPPLRVAIGKDCATLGDRLIAAAYKTDSKETRVYLLTLADEVEACGDKEDADKLRKIVKDAPPGALGPQGGGGSSSSSSVPLILAGTIFVGSLAYIMLGDHK